jgi:hypothetical protein
MSRLAVYEKNRELKAAGKVVGFPLYEKFSKLENYLPSIPKGKGGMITSFSGVGKTKLWKDMFMWQLIILGETQDNFNPKIVINLLEEEREEFEDSFLCDYIFRKTGVVIDPLELNSFTSSPLEEKKYKLVQELEEASRILMNKYVLVEDGVYHATGLFARCKRLSKEWGEHYWTQLHDPGKILITQADYDKLKKDGNQVGWKYSHYIPKDPDQYVLVVTDHAGLITPEYDNLIKKSLNLRESMEKWSFHYGRKQLQKNYNWGQLDIVQQSQSAEEQQFTFRGQSILAKVKPSLANLGDNKALQRNYHYVLSLFNPCRHIPDSTGTEYEGYDFERLKNNFRVLSLLKNRLGRDGVELPLFFNGAVNYFKQLPKPEELSLATYAKIMKGIY